MNSNWPRWIKLSIVQSFQALVPGLPLYVENATRRTTEEIAFYELRLDGPNFNEISKGYWCIDVTIDCLVVTYQDPRDQVKQERDVGAVLAGFNTPIQVMEYGDSPMILVGCLIPEPPPGGGIRTTPFGQVQSDSRALQTTIEQTFRMNLIT